MNSGDHGNTSIDGTNKLVANLKPLYWALYGHVDSGTV